MHKFNIIIYGPKSFSSTLEEIKPYLKFDLVSIQKNFDNAFQSKPDGIICHEEVFNNKKILKLIESFECLKILAQVKRRKDSEIFDYTISLPTTIKDLNSIVEVSAAKKKFNINSSIKVKSYLLDKNQKKLMKNNKVITLTEKEIQLLELFLNNKKPITKNFILSSVWNYSTDADTHTVETHIYRLRKKINETFLDENFILNDKEGYCI